MTDKATSRDRIPRSEQSAKDSVLEFQTYALSRVSRTFALTIPQLPEEIRFVIGNVYLLCRIADTIEDSPDLDIQTKRRFLSRFARVVGHNESPDTFAEDLVPKLSDGTNSDERDLVVNTRRVVDFHRQLPSSQRAPIERCVDIMCKGMSEFVNTGSDGLQDVAQVERYCYFVAGVVGEMITEVICNYSAEIASGRDELLTLATEFGLGLQLINILKDHREDILQGKCWLPRTISYGPAETLLSSTHEAESTEIKVVHLLGVVRGCLEKSLRYINVIPSHETGIRRFLAWTLAFACLTYRRIHANPNFRNGSEVKISRGQVYSLVAAVSVAIRSNWALRWMFNRAMPSKSAVETRIHQSHK